MVKVSIVGSAGRGSDFDKLDLATYTKCFKAAGETIESIFKVPWELVV